MEIGVASAAQRLGVGKSRVLQLVNEGALSARRIGNVWLVSEEDVERRLQKPRKRGRPLSPRKAWAVLGLLDGDQLPWANSKERYEARLHLRALEKADEHTWRSALVSRDDLHAVAGHPAAVRRLVQHEAAILVDQNAVAAADFDLVDLEPIPVAYLPAEHWEDVERELRLRRAAGRPDAIVRAVPKEAWVAALRWARHPGPALLAANLLDSHEPRAIAAGVDRLNSLAAQYRPRRGTRNEPDRENDR